MFKCMFISFLNKIEKEMFVEAPFISLLIFGFPFGVISIVCYFMCCVDASDSPEEPDLSDSEAEEEHQDFLDEASRLLGLCPIFI